MIVNESVGSTLEGEKWGYSVFFWDCTTLEPLFPVVFNLGGTVDLMMNRVVSKNKASTIITKPTT